MVSRCEGMRPIATFPSAQKVVACHGSGFSSAQPSRDRQGADTWGRQAPRAWPVLVRGVRSLTGRGSVDVWTVTARLPQRSVLVTFVAPQEG